MGWLRQKSVTGFKKKACATLLHCARLHPRDGSGGSSNHRRQQVETGAGPIAYTTSLLE
jgi:hypothetical protein